MKLFEGEIVSELRGAPRQNCAIGIQLTDVANFG
jgi:hypothetical protein